MKLQYFKKTANTIELAKQNEALAPLWHPDYLHSDKKAAQAAGHQIMREYRALLRYAKKQWLRSLPRFTPRKLAVIAKHKKRAAALFLCNDQGKFDRMSLQACLVFSEN